MDRENRKFLKKLSISKGTFGRRKYVSFVSGRDLRPPKVPPNMHEFRLWSGVSAAEPAAESALSSFLLHVLCDGLRIV